MKRQKSTKKAAYLQRHQESNAPQHPRQPQSRRRRVAYSRLQATAAALDVVDAEAAYAGVHIRPITWILLVFQRPRHRGRPDVAHNVVVGGEKSIGRVGLGEDGRLGPSEDAPYRSGVYRVT